MVSSKVVVHDFKFKYLKGWVSELELEDLDLNLDTIKWNR